MKMTMQEHHKRNTSNLQKNTYNTFLIYVLKCVAGTTWDSWRAIGAASLPKYIVKPCVFMYVYENGNAETSQAQHI